MNNLRPLLLTGLSLAIPLLVIGQTAPVNPTPPADSEAVVLSPFVVTNQNDEGYRSQFTTAGRRLKTDLKDIAASVSVLTDEFMNDLAANDVASALAFVSGAENDSTYHQEGLTFSGANNYVGGDFGDNNNRSGEVRVRGLGRATTTINGSMLKGFSMKS
jgi:outer membrane receptor for ferric coprogen and ferric-rhodotorulic acid